MIRGVAQLASALAWGARGRKFESSHPDIEKKKARFLPCFFCYYAIAWRSSSADLRAIVSEYLSLLMVI